MSCGELKRLLEHGSSRNCNENLHNTSLQISASTTESVANVMQCLKEHLENSLLEVNINKTGQDSFCLKCKFGSDTTLLAVGYDSDENKYSEKQIKIFSRLDFSSHSDLVKLEQCVGHQTGTDLETSFLCNECIRTFEMKKQIGSFKLIRHYPSNVKCNYGHGMSLDDEQFFANIDTDYSLFQCPSDQEVTVLDGALRVRCRNNPHSFKARICPFKMFNPIVNKLEANHMVSGYVYLVQIFHVYISVYTGTCCGS